MTVKNLEKFDSQYNVSKVKKKERIIGLKFILNKGVCFL